MRVRIWRSRWKRFSLRTPGAFSASRFIETDDKCPLWGLSAKEIYARLRLREPWYGYDLGDWTDEDRKFAQLAVEGKFAEIEAALAKRAVKI